MPELKRGCLFNERVGVGSSRLRVVTSPNVANHPFPRSMLSRLFNSKRPMDFRLRKMSYIFKITNKGEFSVLTNCYEKSCSRKKKSQEHTHIYMYIYEVKIVETANFFRKAPGTPVRPLSDCQRSI